jgi:hypothetical protein
VQGLCWRRRQGARDWDVEDRGGGALNTEAEHEGAEDGDTTGDDGDRRRSGMSRLRSREGCAGMFTVPKRS